MASFYTSVERTAADILYVGYEGNRRVVEKVRFQPTLFVPTRNQTKYRTLDGLPVDTIQPGTMMDCRDFIRENEATNFRIYGNRDYIAQYISDRFPNGCEPDMSLVNAMFIDIEVQSDQGFPEPSLAAQPITAITIKSSVDDTSTHGVSVVSHQRSLSFRILVSSTNVVWMSTRCSRVSYNTITIIFRTSSVAGTQKSSICHTSSIA